MWDVMKYGNENEIVWAVQYNNEIALDSERQSAVSAGMSDLIPLYGFLGKHNAINSRKMDQQFCVRQIWLLQS